MKSLYVLVAVLFFIIILVELFKIFSKKKTIDDEEVVEKEERYPYVKRQYLMTNREREFFFQLKEQYGNQYYIVPQVPLSKIVDVNHYEKHQRGYRSKIDKKTLDYVLFDPTYFTPQIVIELDDSSHELPERKDRDHFVDRVLEQCKIEIRHV